ncbi:MAG TPA: diaminopimelate epimerase [Chitinophagaceae bacterium]
MQVHFYKYQGTGNDFVIMDNRTGGLDGLTEAQVKLLCDRRFGIGGDGLMLLNSHPQYDFEMKYYNSDGRESSMCGNGGRCLVKFAYDIGLVKDAYRFIAVDGEHEAAVNNDGTVSLKMNDVERINADGTDFVLNTGSPHFVQLTEGVMDKDVFKEGRAIRYNDTYKEKGINVNFVEKAKEGKGIIVRTYERGVEDETFSCGTGVTAAALVCYHNQEGFNQVPVQTLGGQLRVQYEKQGDSFKDIWLIGPAQKVFEGTVELKEL